jgi:uncharacterized Tic20 family protein
MNSELNSEDRNRRVSSIIAALQVNGGKPYRYPLFLRPVE